jgi:hypothetical protein
MILYGVDEWTPELYARALEIMEAWIATHGGAR